ncbi:MAG: ABC transporter permease subunit [Methylocystis sp.]|nr:ABC transporter permease subunit [Methylocystis sp.]MCA3587146.1 ABC transporter permease subunit [Methylocystis sp.]MCA3590576.1 ABC transporter permease subunit [Methylocystis sp.]
MPQRGPDRGRIAIIGLPSLWLTVFFLVPFVIILRMSLSDPASAQPPYRPLLDWSQGWAGIRLFIEGLDLENYATILTDPLYASAFLTSVRIAATGTLLTLLAGYPIALAMARASRRWQPFLIALIFLPFWTSFLIRVYAWIAILEQDGLLNQVLLAAGLVSAPLMLLNTEIAVQIGIVYTYLPFMVLPIYAALEKQDGSLVEAAQDLGSTPARAFWQVTLPLSLPGVLGGCILVFIPVMGEFIIPDLLGGSDMLMVGRLVWTEFFSNRDWPMASTIAVMLLAILALPIVIGQRRAGVGSMKP